MLASRKGLVLRPAGALANESSSPDLRQQRTGVADILRVLAALDRGEDRLQQRARVVGRARVAPQPGEVGRGAQFEQADFLIAGDVDRLEEAGLRSRPVRLRVL